MSLGAKMPLGRARTVAEHVVQELAPYCEQIEIAGSVRRKQPQIGDIELVARPRMKLVPDGLFDQREVSELAAYLEQVFGGNLSSFVEKHPDLPKNGERYKKLRHRESGMQVDLFIVLPPAEWGPIFAIRTGPADYSRRAVTELQHRGLKCSEGAIFRGHERLACATEAEFFRHVGWPLLPPEKRK